MSEEKKQELLSKKKKGIIAGSIVASVVIAGGVVGGVVGGLSQNKGYTVTISSELEGFEDSKLEISKGTKVKELKTLITSPIEGYKVAGFYKDIACTVPYSEEEVITENTKVYIKFELRRYTVNVYAEDKETLLETVQVEHGKKIVLDIPEKDGGITSEYIFAGWTDMQGNMVDLKKATDNINVYASYRLRDLTECLMYRIPEQVRVTKGDDEVETGDILHVGERIKVEREATEGFTETNFNITGATLVEGTENIYEVTGDVKVTYVEERIVSILNISSNAKVTRVQHANGTLLTEPELVTTETILTHGDILEIEFNHSGYQETEHTFEGLRQIEESSNRYVVIGDIRVEFGEEKASLLNFGLTSDGTGYVVTGLSDRTITEVEIPATYKGLPVTGIGYSAFSGCSSLTSVNIPNGVTTIGVRAFYNCSSLTSINIPEGVTIIGQAAFSGCSSLTSIYLPDSVTELQMSETFAGCTNLTSVRLSNNLNSIGNHAFSGCRSLTSITITKNVNAIYQGAFSGCTNLKTVTIQSAGAYKDVTESAHGPTRLLDNATTIKILADVDTGTHFSGSAEYTKTTEEIDGEEYNVYTKV